MFLIMNYRHLYRYLLFIIGLNSFKGSKTNHWTMGLGDREKEQGSHTAPYRILAMNWGGGHKIEGNVLNNNTIKSDLHSIVFYWRDKKFWG
jgi:hypothetical protein